MERNMQDRLRFIKIIIKGRNIWFTLRSKRIRKTNSARKEVASLNATINSETFMSKTRIDS